MRENVTRVALGRARPHGRIPRGRADTAEMRFRFTLDPESHAAQRSVRTTDPTARPERYRRDRSRINALRTADSPNPSPHAAPISRDVAGSSARSFNKRSALRASIFAFTNASAFRISTLSWRNSRNRAAFDR